MSFIDVYGISDASVVCPRGTWYMCICRWSRNHCRSGCGMCIGESAGGSGLFGNCSSGSRYADWVHMSWMSSVSSNLRKRLKYASARILM